MRQTIFERCVFGAHVLLLAAMLPAACGSGSSPCGPGNDEPPDIIPDEQQLDTLVIGRVGVDELNQITGADPGHTTLVQAFFADMSNYIVQLADREFYSESCWIYTSQQITSGAPEYLFVNKVVVSGLAGGEVTMQPEAENPRMNPVVLQGRAYGEGDVMFDVTSRDEAGWFPAFTETIQAPEPLVVTQLEDRPDPDLSQGPSIGIDSMRVNDLVVKWVPGGGDYFEFKLIPGAGTETPYAKLRCVTRDDGCLHVPAAAVAALALDKASNFQMKMERHYFKLHPIYDDSGQLQAAVLLDVSSAVEATVLR
ncbi:MAG: hypothetical protein D6806_12795 [Deltaproteobacteria bacterium]|nr:MAG: hypothetical protein D6806_12795 [Deltaproteobacteria bacterium]